MACQVCAGICPFNFPAMIPLWMFPVCTTAGNTMVMKPSEKDPTAAMMLADLALQVRSGKGLGHAASPWSTLYSITHHARTSHQSLGERSVCVLLFASLMTQVEKPCPEATFYSQGSERAACRSETVRLAMGATKAPDFRYGLVHAASDRHDSCHMPQKSRK